VCVCVEITAKTPGAAEPQAALFKPTVGERLRVSGETRGSVGSQATEGVVTRSGAYGAH